MAINKNFIIKNGLEVGTDLIFANDITNTIGIGTTNVRHTLHVNGGIGVTNLVATGIASLTSLAISGSVAVGATSFTGLSGQYLKSTGTGVAWENFPVGRTSTSIIATAGQTIFNTAYSVGLVDIFINGVKLTPSEFVATDGVSITLNEACFGGENVDILAYAVQGLGIGATGITGLTIQDDGILIGNPQGVTSINFVGTAITAAASGAGVTITVSGTASGQSSQWLSTSSGIHTTSNVGIGTTNPTSALTVKGNTSLETLNVSGVATARQFSDYRALVGAASSATETFVVTVATKTTNHRYFGSGSSHGYFIDGKESPFITLLPGKTYRFDQADASNSSHPILFYFDANKTTQYTTNVTTTGTAGNAGAYTEITVTDTTPIVLHYQCVNHGYMGNSVQTNSNFINTPYSINTLGGLSVSGVSTFAGITTVTGPTLFAKQLNVSGVVTATSFVGALTGNVTGNATGLSGTPNINVGTATATSLNVSGVVTATSFVGDGSGITGIIASGAGIIIRDDGALVGAAGSIDFGSGLSVSNVSAGVVTVTSSGGATQFVNTAAGIHTLSNVGIGTTNPQTKLQVERYGVKTGLGTFNASAGIATDIDTFTISTTDFKTTEYTLHFIHSSNMQAQKVLVMQNGTTAYSQEYGVMSDPNLIVSVGATISSGVCKLQVTPETGISGLTTYRFTRETML